MTPLSEKTLEALAKVPFFVILRARSNRRISVFSASVRKEKIAEKVKALDPNLALAPFHDLLSLPVEDEAYAKLEPQQKRERTFQAVRDLFLRQSRERPLVLALEDLHWIDPTTQAFLDSFVGGLATARVLLILLHRPEYTHPWGSHSHYTEVRLDQLSAQASAELVASILRGGKIAPELEELILQRTGGNPLFVEELTRSFLENGSIERKEERYVLAKSLARDALIERSKIVLNLHQFDSKIFEVVRVFYLMTNSKAVVAEVGPETHVEPCYLAGVCASEYERFVDSCAALLSDGERRENLEAAALAAIRRLPQRELLAPLIG